MVMEFGNDTWFDIPRWLHLWDKELVLKFEVPEPNSSAFIANQYFATRDTAPFSYAHLEYLGVWMTSSS